MSSFFAELKRRNVFKVGAAYAIVAWLLIQIASILFPTFNAPEWVMQVFTIVILLGFPVALILAWAYELTPTGIISTPPGTSDNDASRVNGQKVNIIIISLLLFLIIYLVLDKYVIDADISRDVLTDGKIETSLPASQINENGSSVDATDQSATATGTKSIAVLPFTNMSPDKEQEYFADGLTEEIINKLAQIKGLRVTGRTSSFFYKGKSIDLREIGETLGVAYLLEGSIRKSGDQLRITLQLINAAEDYHLWSETYDRKLDDIFTLQDEIAVDVSKVLEISLGVGETGSDLEMTRDVHAYEVYLKSLDTEFSGSGIRESIAYLERAVAIDPQFAKAWYRLSNQYSVLSSTVFLEEGGIEGAEEMSEEAFEHYKAVAPDTPWLRYILADRELNYGDWVYMEKNLQDYRDASSKDRSKIPEITRNLGTLLYRAGRIKDATELLELARTIDPLDPSISQSLIHCYAASRNYQAVLDTIARVEELRGHPQHSTIFHLWVALARKDREQIESVVNNLSDQSGADFSDAIINWLDNSELAIAELDKRSTEYLTRTEITRTIYWLAYFGEPEKALEFFYRDINELWFLSTHNAWWPNFNEMRKLGSFKDFVREIGLVDYWRKTGNWGDFCRPLGEDDFECE